jgi:glyoxylate reductase
MTAAATRPTVVVTRRLPEAVERRLAAAYDARLNADDRQYDADAIVARAAGAAAILCATTERFDRALVMRLPPTVRAIATFSVGYDHIDVAAAAERGIVVTNTPEVLTEATADIAMLCLLGASRRAYEGDRLVRERRWGRWSSVDFLGTGMQGKTLGIVGMGRIGRAVARRAVPFGLTVAYHNPTPVADAAAIPAAYEPSLDRLLARSHFLSLHAPANTATRKMVNAATLARLPRGAIVVNTARGGLIDDEALIAALKSGHIAAAGLDVFEGEPAINPGYLALANVFLLPHIGSATVETREAMGHRAVDNLDAFFAGRAPRDAVRT